MTQAPQIPTLLALQVIHEFGAESEYHKDSIRMGMNNPPVFEILAARSGKSQKQAWRAIEKLHKKDLVALGSSPRIPWLTDAGNFMRLQLEDPEKYGTPPLVPHQPSPAFTYAEKSWSRKHAPAVFRVSDTALEPCTHCGRKPILKRVGLPFISSTKQYRCVCGVAGPMLQSRPWDNSYPGRWVTRMWNAVMLGVKIYGRKNAAPEDAFQPDD